MTEVIGAVTVIGMAAAVGRFCYFVADVVRRIRDELRFDRGDVDDLNRRFAGVFGDRWWSS
jgi:hypothetical protein